MGIRVESVHELHNGEGLVLIIKRNRTRYALQSCHGYPEAVFTVTQPVIVGSRHHGFGAYSQTVKTTAAGLKCWDLDPICAAVRGKGWSQQLIRMMGPSSSEEPKQHRPLTLPTYDPLKTDDTYQILDTPAEEPAVSHLDRIPWAIHISFHKGEMAPHIRVAVPEVYKPDVLLRLLAAIDSLPKTSELKHIHPACLARAG